MNFPISALVMALAFAFMIGLVGVYTLLGGGDATRVVVEHKASPTPSAVFYPLGQCDRMGCISYQPIR